MDEIDFSLRVTGSSSYPDNMGNNEADNGQKPWIVNCIHTYELHEVSWNVQHAYRTCRSAHTMKHAQKSTPKLRVDKSEIRKWFEGGSMMKVATQGIARSMDVKRASKSWGITQLLGPINMHFFWFFSNNLLLAEANKTSKASIDTSCHCAHFAFLVAVVRSFYQKLMRKIHFFNSYARVACSALTCACWLLI